MALAVEYKQKRAIRGAQHLQRKVHVAKQELNNFISIPEVDDVVEHIVHAPAREHH